MNGFRFRRNVSRLEAFSDGVFAFSATLLVVSLEVPSTYPELVSDLKGFLAFGISFSALVLIWSVHETFFKRYPISDRITIVLNAVLLFVVLFYVYPLKFMADLIAFILGIDAGAPPGIASHNELGHVFMLYSAGFVAVFSCIALMYGHVYRVGRRQTVFSPAQCAQALFYARHYAILVGTGLVSVAVAALGWGVSFGLPGMVYALLGPFCYWHARASSFDESMLEVDSETENR